MREARGGGLCAPPNSFLLLPFLLLPITTICLLLLLTFRFRCARTHKQKPHGVQHPSQGDGSKVPVCVQDGALWELGMGQCSHTQQQPHHSPLPYLVLRWPLCCLVPTPVRLDVVEVASQRVIEAPDLEASLLGLEWQVLLAGCSPRERKHGLINAHVSAAPVHL